MSRQAMERHVSAMMKRLMDETKTVQGNDIERVARVRFSGLPFCGVRWFTNLVGGLSKGSAKDFGFSFFTSVGTTVHEVVQKYFLSVEGVELIMDWRCKGCGRVYSFKSKAPASCKSCGGTSFEHEEHTIEFEGALGHIDQLMVIRFGGKTWIIVIDYKTTTIQAVESRGKLPYAENVAQIKGYCAALHDQGYPIMGWALVYIPRDNPFRFTVKTGELTEKDMAKEADWIRSHVEEHSRWMQIKTLDEARELADSRPCAQKLHPRFKDCALAERCAGDDVGCNALLKEAYSKVHTKLPVVEFVRNQREKRKSKKDAE